MASPVAHSLAGIGIYWISRRRFDRPIGSAFRLKDLLPIGLSVVLANISDFDLIIGWIADQYLHHQFSHTLAFALFIGGLAALAAPLFRVRRFRAFWLVTALVASHVVMDTFTKDTTTPKGCMLLWPVTDIYFISPIPIFLDIWRMSPALTFGYNNLNAAIRETALGGLFLLIVHRFHRFPRPAIRYLLPGTGLFIFLAIVAHRPLMTRAERQLELFWGPPPVQAASIAPEGNTGILFASRRTGNMDIFWIQPDGSELKQLTDDPAEDIWPIWSPDGQWIVFQSDRSGNRDVWMMAPDGSGLRNPTRHDAMDESPYWTASGNQIVFSSNRTGEFEIFVMNRDGSNVKQVTRSDAGMELLPAVSPIQDVVAYSANKPLIPGWHIYTLSLNGGNPLRVSSEPGCRARWSPDGQFLAYVSGSMGNPTDIYTFRENGRRRQRLVATPEYDYDPCFAPDGKYVCFARAAGKDKSGWDLWIVAIGGRELRSLTTDGLDNRFPCWR
ncbi:PD40 domain-containing protein [bacterium]|nr:PD40 domain-containing protein [candidate division CSSED10-310 bacterium]